MIKSIDEIESVLEDKKRLIKTNAFIGPMTIDTVYTAILSRILIESMDTERHLYDEKSVYRVEKTLFHRKTV